MKMYKRIHTMILFVGLLNLNLFSEQKLNYKKLADSASTLYKNGKFDQTLTIYKSIIESGCESWKLHFNLANCYFKMNKLGLAIAHYEKALKINPESEDVKLNLDIVSNHVVDKIKTKDLFIENEIRNYFVYKFNTEHWAIITILCLAMSIIFFSFYFLSVTVKMKRLGFWMGISFLIFFIISFALGKIEVNDKNELANAVVIEPQADLFENPDHNSKKITLHDGTRMKILQKEGEWINIQLSNGNEGWLSVKSVLNY
mgnify:CR=1 FL=1